MVLRRAPGATKAAQSGSAVTRAESVLAGLRRRVCDLFLLPRAECSTEPRSLQARRTHTPARCNRVHSGGEWPTGLQLQNRVCLAPQQYLRYGHEAPEKSNASRLKQTPPVLDSIEQPGLRSTYESSYGTTH